MGKPSDLAGSRGRPGRRYALWGLAVALLGPALYMVQVFAAKLLVVPWYLPLIETAAVGLMLLALLQARTGWRFAGLAVCALLAAGEWFFVGVMSKLPDYTGPAAEGKPFPAFTTALADGSTFDRDRMREKDTAFVFFRGRL